MVRRAHSSGRLSPSLFRLPPGLGSRPRGKPRRERCGRASLCRLSANETPSTKSLTTGASPLRASATAEACPRGGWGRRGFVLGPRLPGRRPEHPGDPERVHGDGPQRGGEQRGAARGPADVPAPAHLHFRAGLVEHIGGGGPQPQAVPAQGWLSHLRRFRSGPVVQHGRPDGSRAPGASVGRDRRHAPCVRILLLRRGHLRASPPCPSGAAVHGDLRGQRSRQAGHGARQPQLGLAEYWEWSATGMFAVDPTNDAYRLGVNYIIYGLTH